VNVLQGVPILSRVSRPGGLSFTNAQGVAHVEAVTPCTRVFSSDVAVGSARRILVDALIKISDKCYHVLHQGVVVNPFGHLAGQYAR